MYEKLYDRSRYGIIAMSAVTNLYITYIFILTTKLEIKIKCCAYSKYVIIYFLNSNLCKELYNGNTRV